MAELRVEHVAALSRIYAYLAGARQHLGLFEDADVWARRSIELGRRYGDPQAEAIGYEFLGEDAGCKGEWEQGLGWAAHEEEIAERLRSLAHVRFRRGEHEGALRLIEECLKLVGGTESRIAPLTIGPLHIEVLFALGRREEADGRLRVLSELVAQCQSPFFVREAERLRALLAAG